MLVFLGNQNAFKIVWYRKSLNPLALVMCALDKISGQLYIGHKEFHLLVFVLWSCITKLQCFSIFLGYFYSANLFGHLKKKLCCREQLRACWTQISFNYLDILNRFWVIKKRRFLLLKVYENCKKQVFLDFGLKIF